MVEPEINNYHNNGRIELKYRINYLHYLKLRNAIYPYMKMDDYTKNILGKGYFVRSLYYDTYGYDAYHEKMSGDTNRIKFRMRTYSQGVKDDLRVRVELKVRKANRVEKHSVFVPLDEYSYFLKKRCWQNASNPVLSEFERYLHIKDLWPQVLIDYYREGYQSRAGEKVRITFDHRVRSAHARELFPDHLFFRVHHPHVVVAEIKFADNVPHWLLSLAKSHGLKVLANSKFTQGIQVSRKDLHYPDGVVVVR